MIAVEVAAGDAPYTVRIADGLVDEAGRLLAPLARNGRVAVVSDDNVWAAQGPRLAASLAKAGIAAAPVLVPPGEASKSWAMLERVTERLLALGVERGEQVVAFGGGVVGDLAGFAAGILKRGCGLVQIPTSLLAQVDSSVGGKTAINSAAGKNMVGLFHQPAMVLIDPKVLATLPKRELRAGYAEAVKYALIGDTALFDWYEAHGRSVVSGDAEALLSAIAASVRAKAAIVAEDERERAGGRRALLNLGHTFAHALEAETGFSDRLLHGEAVALGMALAFRFSAERGLCPAADAGRVEAHLRSAGLPTRLADIGLAGQGERLVALMLGDKKASGGGLTLILVRGIGQAFVDQSSAPAEVAGFLGSRVGS